MRIFTLLAGTLVLGACGSMGDSMSAADAAAYDENAQQISSAVTEYRATAATAASPADCQSAVERYQVHVQARIGGMAKMSGRMDDAMESMGQMMGADVECGVQVMQRELDRHMAAACTSLDASENQAEAARHCDAMQDLCLHMRMRAGQVGTMMCGGMMGGDKMDGGAQCGTSSATDGGWQMPDGGVMSWDHTMPGCTYRDGTFQPDDGTEGQPAL